MAVVVAARFTLLRESLAEALDARPQIRLMDTVASAGELTEAVLRTSPDAVLLDLDVPGSLATAAVLIRRRPDLGIVALGAFDDELEVISCAEAGVRGFVTPADGLARLVAVLEAVADERAGAPPTITAALLRRVQATAPRAAAPPSPLTSRELDVLALVDEGLSNKEIATRLRIKLPTVKNHVHNILEKLAVDRRSEAVFHMRRLGLLPGAHDAAAMDHLAQSA